MLIWRQKKKMSGFIEGSPEIFLATFAEKIQHSRPLFDTLKKFSDPITYRASVRTSLWTEGSPDFVLIARPKDPKVSDLRIRLHPDLLGPKMEMLVEDLKQPINKTCLELQLGWDNIGSPDTKTGGWKKDFIASLEIPNLNTLSVQGEWILRVSRYFLKASKEYLKETDPQARAQTLEQLDEELDLASRRCLAVLKERGFAYPSVPSATEYLTRG